MYRVPTALAPAVYIPGLVYEILVRTRNGLYASARLRQERLPRPVISVGNITMGGTGKTPLVIYIAGLLSRCGWAPAILTRGHGRTRSRGSHILQPGETIPSAALNLGDEPALIRRHIPSSWMGVCKNRFHTGNLLSKQHPGMVFVLDDGFQHLKLHRDLDIVVIDASRSLGTDSVFPRGTLREPLPGLRRSHCIVINGPFDSPATAALETELRNLGVKAAIFHCRQSIRSLIPFESWSKTGRCLGDMKPGTEPEVSTPAYLVSAIGNPDRCRRDIRQAGIELTGWTFFADHHRLSRKDWKGCIELARRGGAKQIIITEKDAVKISDPPEFPLLVAVQSTEMAETAAFETILRKAVEEFE